MEAMGSMWGYQESIDEMKHQLLYTSLELETVRAEANEEIKRNKENVTSLLNLLQVAYQERDEARNQLHNLVNKLKSPTPILVSPKPNSSITESNSHSLNSSPVDSLFDPICSPNNSTNMLPFVQDCNGSMLISSSVTKSDPFEGLLKGKRLPEKGRLLQAVVEAGPLLSNILVAGPLPRWRNPPPFCVDTNQNVGKRAFDSGSNLEMCFGVEPTTSSTLSFGTGHRSSGRVFTSGISMNNQIPLAKRQRFY